MILNFQYYKPSKYKGRKKNPIWKKNPATGKWKKLPYMSKWKLLVNEPKIQSFRTYKSCKRSGAPLSKEWKLVNGKKNLYKLFKGCYNSYVDARYDKFTLCSQLSNQRGPLTALYGSKKLSFASQTFRSMDNKIQSYAQLSKSQRTKKRLKKKYYSPRGRGTQTQVVTKNQRHA